MDPHPLSAIDYQHSEEAHDILSKQPSKLVQWGGFVFLLVTLVALYSSWVIRYPDIIVVPFKLTTSNLPLPVYAKESNRVASLLVSEKQQVKRDQVLGFLESRANINEVQALSNRLNTLGISIQKSGKPVFSKLPLTARLGDLQVEYQKFAAEYDDFLSYQKDGYHSTRLTISQRELNQLVMLSRNIALQHDNIKADFDLQLSEYQIQKELFDKKVISTFDFHKEESKLLSKKLLVQQNEALLIENKSAQFAKAKEILDLTNEILKRKSLFLETVRSFQSLIQAWDSKYVLRAPSDGLVNFSSFLEEGQPVTNGQNLFYITQKMGKRYGEVQVEQTNFGKIKPGQRVRINFAGYQKVEYGIVEGMVDFMSEIPDDKGRYQVTIALPKGLITNYGRSLNYRIGMQANAEIITENKRLLSRLVQPIYASLNSIADNDSL